jgi:ABC-type multidrug transport system fused ATPase/permease subunit
VACFSLTAQRQALRIRRLFFRALVSQDMTWFDQQNSGALAVRISEDIPKIQEAIGDKFGAFIQFMGESSSACTTSV